MATIRELTAEGRRRLAHAVAATPGREARLLLSAVLGRGEAALLAHDDESVPERAEREYLTLVDRRAGGEPSAYLVGRREFYGRDFRVDPRVLIPRPETEHLVEIALNLDLPRTARVLDVGTGSGAIALTLTAERPDWKVVATDLSLAALACARANARRLALDRNVAFAAIDLAAALDLASFDLVIANPPYVDPLDGALVATDVRSHEPHLALFADAGGLAVIERLVAAARALPSGATLAFEIGFGQRDAVLELAGRTPGLALVAVVDDTAGVPRDMVFRRTRST